MSGLDKQTLLKNEVDANIALAKGSIFTAVILLLIWIAYLTGLFYVNPTTLTQVNIAFPIFMAVLITPVFLTKTKLMEKPFFKYVLIYLFIAFILVINIILPKHTVLGWALVVVLVNHYYNPKVSLITVISVIILMIVGLYGGMLFGEWDANLLDASKTITLDGREISVDVVTYKERIQYLKELREAGNNRYLKAFLYYYLSRAAIVGLISFACYGLSKRSFKLLQDEAEQVSINQKISNELAIARSIQDAVLPKTFPSTPKGELYALMDPAKEVGGDFYDYFYVDNDHLALVIADVSGKGIPGALFMMKTESLIKSLGMSMKHDTARIMHQANIGLCDNNTLNMFVTCWLGILDLNTGELKYTNAGHNPPLIYQDHHVKYLNDSKSVVLGALPNSVYQENTIKLNKGDKIILYTDGVVETHNNENELFGEERLLEYAENNIAHDTKSFISNLRVELSNYSQGMEQFDDITMLMLEYRKGALFVESKIFKADVKELDSLFKYSSSLLEILAFSKHDIIMINTALEEVFVNVAKYAYDEEGTVEVSLSNDKNKVTFIFKDHGKKFNPLEKEDPNINANSHEREIGGLGIYMVKNIMDEVDYKYENEHNILTLVKYRNKK